MIYFAESFLIFYFRAIRSSADYAGRGAPRGGVVGKPKTKKKRPFQGKGGKGDGRGDEAGTF